jgi:hypothetical protein
MKEEPRWETALDVNHVTFVGRAGPYDVWWDNDDKNLNLAVSREGKGFANYDWYRSRNGGMPRDHNEGFITFDQWPAILQLLHEHGYWEATP